MTKNNIYIGNDLFRGISSKDPYVKYMQYAYRKDTRRLRNLAYTLQKEYNFNGFIADVGANIGITSILLSKIFKNSPIYAFEPNPVVFKTLENNLNNKKKFKLFRFAISDGNKDSLRFSGISAFGHLDKKNLETSIKVPSVSLGSFHKQEGFNKFDLVKIDVEGFELDVIKGLDNCARVIFFEFNPYCINAFYNQSAHKVLSEIFINYRLFKFKKNDELEEITSKSSLESFILNTFRKEILNDLVGVPRNENGTLFKQKKLKIHKYPENIFSIARSLFWLLIRFLKK